MKITVQSLIILCTLVTGNYASADWIFGRASTAKHAKSAMVGMTKEKILECMGAPSQKETAGGDNVNVGTATQIGHRNYLGTSKQMHRYCNVNIVMKKEVVQAVHYSGRTGGIFSGDEQCS